MMIWIAAFGVLGVLLRYGLNVTFAESSLPWSTFLVNIVGSFMIGWFYRWQPTFIENWDFWKVPIAVGFLGGLTTFSSFTLDILKLIESGRMSIAIIYASASVFFSLVLCWIGMKTAQY